MMFDVMRETTEMKNYITPKVIVFEVEVADIVANTRVPFSPEESDDFSPQIRRGTAWEDYEN